MEASNFWAFLLKVRERLILIIENNIRNHIPLEEIDEQVLLEMYAWYLRSDLFQPESSPEPENAVQTTITDIKS